MPAYSLFERHLAKRQTLRWFRLFHFASKEMVRAAGIKP